MSSGQKLNAQFDMGRFWTFMMKVVVPVAFTTAAFLYALDKRVSAVESSLVSTQELECSLEETVQQSNEKFTMILVEIQALKNTAAPWMVDRIDKLETRILKLEGGEHK